ncbi:hypothetical protein HFC70_25275 [Agrobacterium sp. a22-2]|uniref:hypothetical protein n=1 Tax=Agrobacterium sp. a22-2 TaxID=2283840 RepID=UPI001446B856|nr:hypothetical protein [Agrobacterium sp. a22-2]NKN39665.1 hypothetical protein [Agrobacterium sp. a22-2]
MPTTLSSREFDRDTGGAKRAAESGPVFITEQAKTTHVLLSIDDYKKLTRQHRSVADMLSMPGDDDIDFEPEKLGDMGFKPATFD